MTPLGETLRRARTAKNITLEDAERVTRIPRKYLEALEVENYGILPAPVFARGFLRSYAGYLGLNPAELLPFFPVGHVEEPALDPLPEVKEPRTWNASGLVGVAVVGLLILIVLALYSLGREDSDASFFTTDSPGTEEQTAPILAEGGAGLEDLAGESVETAIRLVQEKGADYVLVCVSEGDVPSNQVIDQKPPPGEPVGPGDTVTIFCSR